MASLIFNIEKVEIASSIETAADISAFDTTFDADSNKLDLGKTQGGGSFAQDIQELEIASDQDTDPVEILVQSAPKTLTLNLLEAEPKNLALAFGVDPDTITGTDVEIPLAVNGVEKSLRITTKAVGGKKYIFRIPKIKFKGTTSISFTKDNASTIPLEGKVLAPSAAQPVFIEQTNA